MYNESRKKNVLVLKSVFPTQFLLYQTLTGLKAKKGVTDRIHFRNTGLSNVSPLSFLPDFSKP